MDSKTETVSDIARFMDRWVELPDGYFPHPYDESWDQLMLVVEKIEGVLLQVSIHTAYVNICGELNGVKYNQDTCFESQNDTKLTVTYRAVVRAIHFINSQSPDTIK